jgi:hypothetical protein
VEPEPKVQVMQAQVEAITNLALDQGKPGVFNQYSLSFILNLCCIFYYDCALSL